MRAAILIFLLASSGAIAHEEAVEKEKAFATAPVEQTEAGGECALEAFFLGLKRRLDHLLRARQFGEGFAHLFDEGRHQLVHDRFGCAQKVRVAHGTAHDAAQDIAAAFV